MNSLYCSRFYLLILNRFLVKCKLLLFVVSTLLTAESFVVYRRRSRIAAMNKNVIMVFAVVPLFVSLVSKVDAQVLANFTYDGSVATLTLDNLNPDGNWSLESLIDTNSFTLAGYTGGLNISNTFGGSFGWNGSVLELGNTDRLDSLASIGDTFDVGYGDQLSISWNYNNTIAGSSGSNTLRFMTDGGTAIDVPVTNWLYEAGQAPGSAIPEPGSSAAIIGFVSLLGFVIYRRRSRIAE